MKRFLKSFRYGQRGFTLIELLIVVAILGILAAVIVPNLASFLGTGKVAAANTEAANVETAALAYMADNNGTMADGTTSAALADYLSDTPKATYTFNSYGRITSATTNANGWGTDIHWDTEAHQWVKGSS